MEYAISAKKYPNSIISMDVSFSMRLFPLTNIKKYPKHKNILFLTGKSFVSDNVQILIYLRLIYLAKSLGYDCLIKDHPNPAYRLNISLDHAINLDPLIPSELLNRDFSFVVGVSSTALLAFNERSICLLNLIVEMDNIDRALCVQHFEKALPGNNINYINSIEDFKNLLKELKL